MKKEEKIVIVAFICCIILAFLSGVFCKIDKDYIREIDVSNISTLYPSDYTVFIDSVAYTNDRLVVRGWAAQKGKFNANIQCVVKDEHGKFYVITTRSIKRDEVTAYFNDGNDYSNAGFIATGKIKAGRLEGIGEVYVLVKDQDQNNYLIATGNTIKLG